MHCHPFARHLPLLLLAPILLCSTVAHAQELMPTTSSGWSGFAPRAEGAPGLLATPATPYALEVHGNGIPNVYGGWRTTLQGLSGSRYYRLRARALPVDVTHPRESITILLRWRGSFGDRVAPDYVWDYRTASDGSLLFDRVIESPAGTTAVDVELVLQWAAAGRVRFDALSFMPASAPAPRPVTLAAVSYRPSGTGSGVESVQRAAQYGQTVAAAHRPDVMVFGELLNVIGAPGSFDDKAEGIPGQSTEIMAALARTYGVNVAFGMLERHGQLLYNTAVLIDRGGAIVGTYRKMQLPLSEVAAGVTPGARVPVFDTDIGRVALLICQDTAFPEPPREAAIGGAEILLVPIWGGKQALMTARAIEGAVYVVASGYDYASEILGPLGDVLDRVETLGQADAAISTIDLTRRFREDWSGDWRDVSNKQRRFGVYAADEGGSPGEEPPPPPPVNVPPSVAITTPSSGATFTAPATISLAASASDSDGSVARVDFYAGTMLLGSDTSSPYTFTWTGALAGSYTLTARATDNVGATTTSASVSITVLAPPPPPPSLPAPWQSQDIGAVGLAGSATAAAGTFTVEGAGADIWGTADAFHYVWQPIAGDATVVARVTSMDVVHDWVKAGVMIRERLTADSPHALMLVSPGKGLAFQRRVAQGGISVHTSGGTGTAPAWVKLERRGSVISAYRSSNGTTWTLVGSDTFASMPATVYVGLAVSSHYSAVLAAAAFDNVAVSTDSALPAGWEAGDIGAVGVAGEARASGGTFTIRGSGADIWDTADAFQYVWQRWSGDGDIVTRVSSVEYVHAWVKAGVMVREHLTADSPHALMLVSPGKGLAFQRRVTPGGISVHTSGGTGTAPAWVKLERRGNILSAYRSSDGVSWTFVGNDTFTMGADVYVGLVVSSHDNSRAATATFEHVTVR